MSESIREVLAREAAEAEARADAEERGEVAPTPGQRGRNSAADPSQVYSVRIPVSKLRQLRVIAERLDMPPTALIRQWVIERLDEQDAKDSEGLAESFAMFREKAEPAGRDSFSLGPSRRHGSRYRPVQAVSDEVRQHA